MLSSLQHVFLLQDLSQEDFDQILPLVKTRTYKKNQILIHEDDDSSDIYILREGLVKVYRLYHDKEIILNFQFPGDIIGEMETIATYPRRVATVETMETSHFWIMNRSDFISIMERHPSVLKRAYNRLLDHLSNMNNKVRYLSYLDVRLKLANLLLDLYYNLGKPAESAYKIDCKVTHHLLANMIGVTRESISKVMRELQDEGVLMMNQKYIYITDLEKLQSMCDDMDDSPAYRKWRSQDISQP
ncbi:Crp/Fnr family transcriptional regulator [Paenibacillus dendritiformis]|uniref:Crp/Fnr family transcriptional regulator n=1 Tax=Paenibacillus dendritiformis TaxID=130049 RepID=UPI001B01EAF9|nr:Crp/Fnr family transcriptional regulator [Paenibacillus dendritiformis]GIO73269.1 Crp/Fnr family transcriptional regulator [Paenibacillus dendritiformis]